jgi:hypothetical protein
LPSYEKSVFVNCPFDAEYKSLRDALLFAVHDCGFVPRCALDVEDSGGTRVSKILEMIGECQYGIHDISRTETNEVHGEQLPRFNMPYELGLFVGATQYGTKKQKAKRCLVLDRQRHRYQAFISDIAGQDIQAHDDDPDQVVAVVRNWLRAQLQGTDIILPGAQRMIERYHKFQEALPKMCAAKDITPEELTHADYTDFVYAWLITYR